MDSKTVVELILTAVIAVFAGATWWATKTYAYVTGLAFFIQTNKEIVGIGQGIERGMARQSMRAIRKRFPKVYDDMRACMIRTRGLKLSGKSCEAFRKLSRYAYAQEER